jgi:murein DD-endopeptidase MepM/ murein hydrolase activator NlpD
MKGGKVLSVVDGYGANTGYLGNPDGGKYGNHIVVQMEDGSIATYGHLKPGILVKPGQTVYEGQTLGDPDQTGSSTGSHLHVDVKDHPGGHTKAVW